MISITYLRISSLHLFKNHSIWQHLHVYNNTVLHLYIHGHLWWKLSPEFSLSDSDVKVGDICHRSTEGDTSAGWHSHPACQVFRASVGLQPRPLLLHTDVKSCFLKLYSTYWMKLFDLNEKHFYNVFLIQYYSVLHKTTLHVHWGQQDYIYMLLLNMQLIFIITCISKLIIGDLRLIKVINPKYSYRPCSSIKYWPSKYVHVYLVIIFISRSKWRRCSTKKY